MKYQQTIDYPVSCEHLFARFSDPGFIMRKYAAQGATGIALVSAEQDADGFCIVVSREVPVDVDVPAFARSLVPATITLVQTDRWHVATGQGSLDIEFKGMPVRLHCDMRIVDTPAGAHQVLDFDIKVSVPLLGGKLEKLLADDLQLKFGRDTEASLRLLAETATA